MTLTLYGLISSGLRPYSPGPVLLTALPPCPSVLWTTITDTSPDHIVSRSRVNQQQYVDLINPLQYISNKIQSYPIKPNYIQSHID